MTLDATGIAPATEVAAASRRFRCIPERRGNPRRSVKWFCAEAAFGVIDPVITNPIAKRAIIQQNDASDPRKS